MSIELPKNYEAKETESKIYQTWIDSGFFNPDNLPHRQTGLPGSRDQKYTIAIAPPNVTGSLHMGHALENTGADILIRYHRMRGFKTLWLPGTDHAGIATQNIVEKDLKKQGISRHDLGKEKFLEKIWEWKEQYGGIILDQLKRLGCSMDWSRTRFTMDPQYQEAVTTAFKHYYEKGLIYQGERVINWCIKDQTALSDLELEYIEEKSKLWHLKYPIKDSTEYVVVATTRPETMLGDTAIAVNPKDERYKHLIGKTIMLPIVQREIPIVADYSVAMEFGTGAVKVTPAHDLSDSEIAERNNLPYLKIINEVGKIINVGPDFDGLKITEARTKVIEQFTELGLLEKEQDLVHNVAKCYRCGSTIEPTLSKQWFLKMKPLAEKTITAIEKGEITYIPERWQKVSLDWLHNVRDWCISRQIWWGHKVPIDGVEDVFDTWFSSALWPFATLGWPHTDARDLKEFYPTQLITSGRDIIHLWISRMIYSGLEFMDKAPFKDILIHATVLTKDGRRMSKSLGTGIDPLDLIEKYGADATRFGLMYQAMGGQEIHFNEDGIMMGKKFANKLWNIARYVLGTCESIAISAPTAADEENKKILTRLDETITSVSKDIESYAFGDAAHTLYDFIWHDFADKYIEYSKDKTDQETKDTLSYILITILKLIHPFMPFVTEELWSHLPIPDKHLLIVSPWPK